MQKGLLLTIIIYVVFSTQGKTQSIDLIGVVKDAETSEILVGATVIICDEITATDNEGKFQLSVTGESCNARVSYIGYELFEEEIVFSTIEGIDFIIFLKESSSILDQAVITATKFEERRATSTATLELLEPELIDQAAVNSIDEALDLIPGVDVIDGQANIRGGSGFSYGAGSRVLLVLDGMPMLQNDGGIPNWDDIPVESVSRVEVLKGASSVLYGSSALNGVINVRTKAPSAEPITRFGSYYKRYFEPEDPKRIWWQDTINPFESSTYLTHSNRKGKIGYTVSGLYHHLFSYNKDVEKQRGRIRLSLDYFIKPNIHLTLNSQVNALNNSTFFYWGNALTRSFQPGEGTLAVTANLRYNIDPILTIYDRKNNKHEIKGRYYHVDNDSEMQQGILTDQFFLNYQYFHNLPNINAEWAIGTDLSYNHTIAPLFGNAEYSGGNAAGYFQYTQRLFKDKLKLNAGVRFEYFTLINPDFSYRVRGDTFFVAQNQIAEYKPVFRFGANYNAWKGGYIRASWGEGYRYPTIAEKFTATTFGGLYVIPNPELQSETGWSSEIGIRQEMAFNELLGYVDVAGFVSRYFNMMEFAVNPDVIAAFQAQNIGNTQISGFEVGMGWQYEIGKVKFQLQSGYTYIDPIYLNFDDVKESSSSEENILKYRYNHSLKNRMSIGLYGFELWINQRYNSNMEAIDKIFLTFIPGIENFLQAYTDGYNVYSCQLSYTWKKQRISFNLNNVFNTLYAERPAYLSAPRNGTVKLDFQF